MNRKFQNYQVESSYIDESKEGIMIWKEGYIATGEAAGAQLLGIFKVNTFDEAVEQYNKNTFFGHRSPAEKGPDGLWRIWGCCLYDNEVDARKSFR